VKILSKAGYSGAWVLIGLVPIANLVMFLVFAFSDWPVVRAQRAAQAGLPPGYGYPPGDGGYSGYAGSGQSLGATPGSTPGGVSPPQPIPGQVYPPPGDGPQV
jgi:hypothetical protein